VFSVLVKKIKVRWVTLSHWVFLNKVLIIWPNTTYRSRTIVLYYTLQHVSAVQISLHQVDVGYTKRNIMRERLLFAMLWIVIISFQKWKT